MALETLKNVTSIDGFTIGIVPQHGWTKHRVYINHQTNTIGFRIQNGPIKEVGVKGCQVDTLIAAARMIIAGLNKKFPCEENDIALTHLNSAYDMMKQRKAAREKRGVEGLNKK